MQESRVITRVEEKRVYVKGEGFVTQQEEITFTAYRSRWGWHPISREDFQILKAVHKRYWETLRAAYQWARWFRKAPQNRVIRRKRFNTGKALVRLELPPSAVIGREVVGEWEEPTVDPLFINKDIAVKFYTPRPCGFSRGHHIPFRPLFGCPVPQFSERRGDAPSVILDLRKARTPMEDPQDLAPLDMTPYRAVWDTMMAGAV